MEQAITIFVAGLGGVFIGMALLYIAIRLTSLLIEKIGGRKEK